MRRVYLDSQIYRYQKNDIYYSEVAKRLLKYSDNLLYCYSQGHISDLQRDTTDNKWDDLKFMERYVDDNYLCYASDEKRTNCYLAKSIEAFSRHIPIKIGV